MLKNLFELGKSFYLGQLVFCLLLLLLIFGSGGTILAVFLLAGFFHWMSSRPTASSSAKPPGKMGWLIFWIIFCWPAAIYYGWTRRW